MKLLTKTHKIIVSLAVIISLLIVGLLVKQHVQQNAEVLSETDYVNITAEVPHIITIRVKPESRIPPIGNDELPIEVEIRPEGSLVALRTYSLIATDTGDAYLGAISIVDIPVGTYDIAIKAFLI